MAKPVAFPLHAPTLGEIAEWRLAIWCGTDPVGFLAEMSVGDAADDVPVLIQRVRIGSYAVWDAAEAAGAHACPAVLDLLAKFTSLRHLAARALRGMVRRGDIEALKAWRARFGEDEWNRVLYGPSEIAYSLREVAARRGDIPTALYLLGSCGFEVQWADVGRSLAQGGHGARALKACEALPEHSCNGTRMLGGILAGAAAGDADTVHEALARVTNTDDLCRAAVNAARAGCPILTRELYDRLASFTSDWTTLRSCAFNIKAGAGSSGSLEVLRLKLGVGIDVCNSTTLTEAAKGGHLEVLIAVLQEFADDKRTIDSLTADRATHLACRGGHIEIARILVERVSVAQGHAVNFGWMLAGAAEAGRAALKSVSALAIERGAIFNIADLCRALETAASIKAEGAAIEAVQFLLNLGAIPTAKGAVLTAWMHGHFRLVVLLQSAIPS